MKLLKKFGKTVAVAALLVPTLVNASATSSVDLVISQFLINFGGNVQIFPEGVPSIVPDPAATRIDVSAITYAGTNATAEYNGVINGQNSAGTPPFNLMGTIGTPAVDGAIANSNLTGELFTLAPVSGTTTVQAAATGTNTASADAQIINSFDSGIRFDVQAGADLIGNTVSFNWLLDLLLSVFDQGGTANYTYEFDFSIAQQGSFAAPFEYALSAADTGFGTSGSIQTLNTVGTGGPQTGSVTTAAFDLLAGETYTVTINQTASTAVTSVAAPGTVALFGASLLGVALIRRRKAK